MLSKGETRERIIKTLKEISFQKPTGVEFYVNLETITDEEITKELGDLFFEIKNKISEQFKGISDKEILMISQAQIENLFSCTYEDLFEYYLKYYV